MLCLSLALDNDLNCIWVTNCIGIQAVDCLFIMIELGNVKHTKRIENACPVQTTIAAFRRIMARAKLLHAMANIWNILHVTGRMQRGIDGDDKLSWMM
jgi:hypothetical protein